MPSALPFSSTVIPRGTAVGLLLLFALSLPQPTSAGVNQGGVLVAHDPGLVYTIDAFAYPSQPPANCDGVDADLPLGLPPDGAAWIWKVYAAFPADAHPRLKATAFGAVWDPTQIRVQAGGVPDPYWDFEVPDDGWPTMPETGVGVSLHQADTGRMCEVYWLAGYAYSPGRWTLTHHPVQAPLFVDDAFPPNQDPIAGFGAIGFGVPGSFACAVVLGACCRSDGTCSLLSEAACVANGGVQWGAGITCSPWACSDAVGACCLPDGDCTMATAMECSRLGGIPWGPGIPCEVAGCPPPEGACCNPSGFCSIQNRVVCENAGASFLGPLTTCTPNLCPQPAPHGACCLGSGQCVLLTGEQCAEIVGAYLGDDTVCIPNPCPQPVAPGACCLSNGTCIIREAESCAAAGGLFHGVGTDCGPNPCPQPTGACCLADAACEVLTAVECQGRHGTWIGAGSACSPAPCDTIPGACCSYDGSCRLMDQSECGGIFLVASTCSPNPCLTQLGACCFPDGSCLLELQGHCLANGGFYWWEATNCAPNPCDAILRLIETNWGRVKFLYRR